MRTYRKMWLTLGALVALGCGGNAVDLGHGPDDQGWSDAPDREASTSTPQTIYDGDLPILGFAVEGPTLYALVYSGQTYDLISCPLERCRSQRTTLNSTPKVDYEVDHFLVPDTKIVVAGERVFWHRGTELMACPITGCAKPQRVSLVAGHGCFAADADTLYWLDRQQTVQRLKPNTDVPERVHGPIGDVLIPDHLVVGGDYLYISDPRDGSPNIRRVRKDGTGNAELVVEDAAISGLSAAGDSIYYPSTILGGRIVECAPADCAKSAVTRANHQRWPMEVRIAGDEAFWLTQTRMPEHPSNSDISSCRLPECNPVEIRVANFPLDYSGPDPLYRPHLAVSPEWVLWLEGRLQEVGSSLRRLAR